MLLGNKLLTLQTTTIDGSLLASYEFADKTGYSGKHHRTGVKVSVIVEGSGIPLAMVAATGNMVDITLANRTVDCIRIPQATLQGSLLNGDKGYDCLDFRRHASDFGLLPNIPKRECTPGDNDKTFLYYLYDKLQARKRFVVERTNAWVKSFKRLRFRFDYKASSFEAFLYLVIIVICVRRLLP
jgi:DDE family transposase